MSDQIDLAIEHFDQERYREALLVFEAIWHHERSEGLRILVLLSNSLNQLRLGLIIGPRQNLNTALRLIAEHPLPAGLPSTVVRQYLEQIRAMIPDQATQPGPDWATIPRLRLGPIRTDRRAQDL
ncbi:MAG: hypothetical protein Fur005_31290 [Roseiflexaceae bacterium]